MSSSRPVYGQLVNFGKAVHKILFVEVVGSQTKIPDG